MSKIETVLVVFMVFCGVIPFALILVRSVLDLRTFVGGTKEKEGTE